MPYQNLEDGLYLIEQSSDKNGIPIKHYGVLDVGNILQHPAIDGTHPIVVHQTPPNIRADFLGNTGTWSVLGKVTDLSGAIERVKEAIKNPAYDLFGNNCEHFARFVAMGRRYSSQVFWGGAAVVALSVLAFYTLRE
ncbi:MAG TPA: hypothetical protein VIM93_12195 [Kangiella sp.]